MKKKSMYLVISGMLCLVFLLSACGMPGFLQNLGKKGADIDTDTTPVTVESTVNMMELEGVYSEQMAHRATPLGNDRHL